MKTLPSIVMGVVIGAAAASVLLRNVIGADVAPAATSATAGATTSASAASATPAATTASAADTTAPKPAPVSTNVHPISKNIIDRLTKSPRHFDIVPIKQGDREVETYVFYPMTKNKAMAVVLIHEIYGLSDWMRAAGDQLAEAGYIVLVPDLLSGMGPHKGGTEDFPEAQVMTAIQRQLPAGQAIADVNAVIDYAKKIDSCNGNVAVGGFCWGGGQAFAVAAENKDIKAAFVFYGSPMLPVADMPKVNVPVYGFYGENDARLATAVPAEQAAMKAAGKSYDAIIYAGADHGFMRLGQMDDATPTNKKAAEDSWKRWLEILRKVNAADNDAKPADAATKPAADTATKPAAATDTKPAATAAAAPKPNS